MAQPSRDAQWIRRPLPERADGDRFAVVPTGLLPATYVRREYEDLLPVRHDSTRAGSYRGAMNRPYALRPGAISVLDAGLALGIAIGITVGTAYLSAGRDPGPLGYALLTASAGLLAVRRLAGSLVLVSIVILTIAYAAISGPNVAFALPLGVALYTVTDAGRWQLAVAASSPSRSARSWPES